MIGAPSGARGYPAYPPRRSPSRRRLIERALPGRPWLLATLLVSLVTAPALAGPFQEGCAAWQRQSYVEAAGSFRTAMMIGDAPPEWCSWYLAQIDLKTGETVAARVRLEMLAANPGAPMRYRAADLLARIHAADGQVYAAARLMLDLASDSRLGPRARFRAGELLLGAGDTPAAVRAWSALCTLHPDAPSAHRAVLRILDLSGPIPPVGDYELYLLARSAAAAGDFTTADVLLESTVRRRMDRRLRDDLLRLHGDVLLRMSQYERALEAYREARTMTFDPALLDRIDRRIVLCRLYKGDTNLATLTRRRTLASTDDPEFLQSIQVVAALRRLSGDDQLSRALPSLVGVPTFEAFLVAWEDAGGWSATDTSSSDAFRVALAAADGLTDPRERALSMALLARNDARRAVDRWRGVLYETDDEWLARRAAAAIRAAPGARALWEAEADQLLSAALRALQGERPTEALRHLRVCRLGYPGTRAAGTAASLARQIVGPWLEGGDDGGHPRIAEARLLLAAGAPDAAAITLEDVSTPAARTLRLFALEAAGQLAELVAATTAWQSTLPARVLADELPDSFVTLLHPAWRSPVFRNLLATPGTAAGSRRPRAGIAAPATIRHGDAALLHAIAFTISGLDPYYQSGYRLGLMGTDAEATTYAREFAGAPHLAPVDLLSPESAVPFAAWLIHDLAQNLGETEPHRLAAAWLAGPGFLAPPPGASPLVTLARLPFPTAREQFLRFLAAHDAYLALYPPASARPAPARPAPPPARSAARPAASATAPASTRTPARAGTTRPAAPAQPAPGAPVPSARIVTPAEP